MPRKKHLIDKQIFKKSAGKCRICGETNYALLDVHRILEGSNGGKYEKSNSSVLCSNCHRKVHDGQIIIDRYYPTTGGLKLRIIREDGKEDFV